jgi:hypothetical protein
MPPAQRPETAMPDTITVEVRDWIDAPLATVRAQFADLDHQIRRNLHPDLRFEVLDRRTDGLCFRRVVRHFGLRLSDTVERRVAADGAVEDRVVRGVHRGSRLCARFAPGRRAGHLGTEVSVQVSLPLPPVLGPWLRPLVAARLRLALAETMVQHLLDIEGRGYPARGALPAQALTWG